MVKDKPNGWLQLLDNNGSFAIKSAYATIQDLRMGGIAEELFIQLWKVDAPPEGTTYALEAIISQ